MTSVWLLLALRALLGLSLLVWSVYTSISLWAAWRWRRSRPPLDSDWTPGVSILKPVRGVDAEAYANFAGFCKLNYPADKVQIVFGALDAQDPALELARQVAADHPECDIEIVVAGQNAVRGHNFKVCNLIAMLPSARHDLLVLCDSDMRVQPDYLRRIVAPFRDPGVGLVTCPYRGCRPQSLAALLEALSIGADFIPSAFVSRALEGVSFAFGSTIALPRRVLEQLNGFEALLDELADDFRLGDGARRAGYTVVLSDYVVDDMLGPERFGPMWARRLRWARTVRACRPAGYAGSCVTHGTALGLLFCLSMGGNAWGLWALAGVIAFRCISAIIIGATCTEDTNLTRGWPLLPLSDLLSFMLYVASYCGNRITWRGERFRLLPGGKIVHLT